MSAPTPEQRAFRDTLIAVMQQHGATLRADELLAVASHLVGQIIALQDQRTMTPAMAMEIVARNIELGNQDVIAGLLTAPGGSA